MFNSSVPTPQKTRYISTTKVGLFALKKAMFVHHENDMKQEYAVNKMQGLCMLKQRYAHV